jgi:hypothetical protein
MIENHGPRAQPITALDVIMRERLSFVNFAKFKPSGSIYTCKGLTIPHIIIMEHLNKFYKTNIRYAKISLKVNISLTQKRMQLVR